MTTTLALQSMPVNTDRTPLDVQALHHALDVQAHLHTDSQDNTPDGDPVDRPTLNEPTRRKTAKGRKRLSAEQIAAREAHQRAEHQLDVTPQTTPVGAGHEPPTGIGPAHPPTRTGRDTRTRHLTPASGQTNSAETTDTASGDTAGAAAARAGTDADSVEPSSAGTAGPATYKLRSSEPNLGAAARRAQMQTMDCEGPRQDVAAVTPTAISVIAAVPYAGYPSDRALLTILVGFARWCLYNTADGTFTPARDLNEDAFEDYLALEKQHVTEQTRSTYRAQLRRLARQGRRRRKGTRKRPAAPYIRKVQDRLWQEAADMTYWGGLEMLTLQSLTFGAGCTAAEVHTTAAGQVGRVGNRVVLTIIKDRMWVRDVPVYGRYGQWLDRRSRELEPDQWLFLPHVTHRTNATSDLVLKMRTRNTAFTGFKSTRARHTWLLACLQSGIPFYAVCQAAGINRDSNLPTELLPYMPQPSPAETKQYFDIAFATRGVSA